MCKVRAAPFFVAMHKGIVRVSDTFEVVQT